MRFKNFDLNLLVAFQALVEERNVTRAAERLNLSQPAMSGALRRLRAAFSDDILVSIGRKMVPTAHAQALMPLVTESLIGMQSLISLSARFDPATSQRTFRIIASDYITMVLLAPLLPELEREAPHIRLDIVPAMAGGDLKLDRGEVDLMICPEPFVTRDHPHVWLFDETHVAVGWNGNAAFQGELTREAYFSSGHVAVDLGRTSINFGEDQLDRIAGKRRIELVAHAFSVVPWLLIGTHRIATMYEKLARMLEPSLPLAVSPLPFEMPGMSEVVQFNAARREDSALHWLIGKLQRSASAF